jgi:hypothetical protein
VGLAYLEYQSVVPELPAAPRPPGAVLGPNSLADEAMLPVCAVSKEMVPAELAWCYEAPVRPGLGEGWPPVVLGPLAVPERRVRWRGWVSRLDWGGSPRSEWP